jgi:hypothetical protein
MFKKKVPVSGDFALLVFILSIHKNPLVLSKSKRRKNKR